VTVTTRKERKNQVFSDVFSTAHSAGLKAARETTPTPMIVQEHENMLDDHYPVKKSYLVPSGVCGFAWINVTPGTSSFAKWLVANGYAQRSSYYGGVTVNTPREFGQGMERKEAYAHAFAKVLNVVRIKAHSMSRMD
jgi:hypothetical protein